MLVEILDFAILGWLIFTWFYEGHHRKCKVEVLCPVCKKTHDEGCKA